MQRTGAGGSLQERGGGGGGIGGAKRRGSGRWSTGAVAVAGAGVEMGIGTKNRIGSYWRREGGRLRTSKRRDSAQLA